jgi:hypothetical protein
MKLKKLSPKMMKDYRGGAKRNSKPELASFLGGYFNSFSFI